MHHDFILFIRIFQLKLLDVILMLADPTQNVWKDTEANLNVNAYPDSDQDLFQVQVVNLI